MWIERRAARREEVVVYWDLAWVWAVRVGMVVVVVVILVVVMVAMILRVVMERCWGGNCFTADSRF